MPDWIEIYESADEDLFNEFTKNMEECIANGFTHAE
tara:strand:+ start:178 stop:285 length:108 start_codon:yes stop_codon:yes gene_type:complete